MKGNTRMILTQEDKVLLLQIARNTLNNHLNNIQNEKYESSNSLQQKYGAFVSLHIAKSLRGCIGNMIGYSPLVDTIQKMAIASAFKDPRFPPVNKKEIEKLKIEISVLSPLHKIASIDEIEIGIHGLYLTKGLSSGVFLPQVAIEQGWNKIEFLSNCCYKAGLYDGEAWKDKDTKISVAIFEVVIISFFPRYSAGR